MDGLQPPLGLTALDRRLDRGSRDPIAVAYSGGGDSLAALITVKAWADRAGRPVIALHVDHGLQAASGDWARLAARNAERLGADFRLLPWIGDKPATGLSAAARIARHTLIAEAARAAGAKVVVLGHTADDRLEADWMRAEGASLGRPAEWRPSPIWPQGRGIFLLRPLLALGRAQIRQALADCGLDWIEDPANADPRSLRARARAALAGEVRVGLANRDDGRPDPLAAAAPSVSVSPEGVFRIARSDLLALSPDLGRRLLASALVCAGGGSRPPRRERLEALWARLAASEPFTASLAGARLEAGAVIEICREAGDYRRHGAPVLTLQPGEVGVWDGRVLVTNGGERPVTIAPLAGLIARLPVRQRQALGSVPPAARGGLPAMLSAQAVTPLLALDGADNVRSSGVDAKSLVLARFSAAIGGISKEPEI
ncbi:MAG: tRNA lysidine(34) synthetase TilS [Caulobacteraceae bacterium]|nr:tRNA lysidine(34) synthetase TilS [Caulobacteraceae bacterium]